MKIQPESLHDFDTFEKFSADLLFRELELFRGSQNPKIIVSDFIEKETAIREEDAKSEGLMESAELSEGIKSDVEDQVGDYVSSIIRVAQLVCDEASEEFTDEQLRIAQVRTSFDFRTWFLKILFIIDADPRTESSFSDLLGDVEKLILLEESFIAELHVTNKRDHGIDPETIRSSYPFVGKVRVKP